MNIHFAILEFRLRRSMIVLGFPGGLAGKESACMRETWVQSLGWEEPWRREELPTPVFWRGEFGLYSPWGYKEWNTTEPLSLYLLYNAVSVSAV